MGESGIVVDRWIRFLFRDQSLSLSLTATMVDLTRKLPLELLAEILGHASAPDVWRFKLVSGDHQWVDR